MDYHLNYGDNYFPEKKYKGVKYPSGIYESLVVSEKVSMLKAMAIVINVIISFIKNTLIHFIRVFKKNYCRLTICLKK